MESALQDNWPKHADQTPCSRGGENGGFLPELVLSDLQIRFSCYLQINIVLIVRCEEVVSGKCQGTHGTQRVAAAGNGADRLRDLRRRHLRQPLSDLRS